MPFSPLWSVRVGVTLLLLTPVAIAQTSTPTPSMEVTVTRTAEPVDEVPASVTILSGADLEATGVRDLRGALSMVAGVEGTPGGDLGGAGSVPALWGLREADAFLLVVDGVPWGGAFNPATTTVNLTNVDRIEVLRGPAPVMFGATAFVGVIHIIHRAAAQTVNQGSLALGSAGSYLATAVARLPSMGDWQQSLTADLEHRGYREDRTDWRRAHALYRGDGQYGGTHVRLDVDLSAVPQQPPGNLLLADNGVLQSELSPTVNFNPAGAKLNGERYHAVLALDGHSPWGTWTVTMAATRSLDTILRGYLRGDAFNAPPDAGVGDGLQADGYSQHRGITDLYLDAYLVHAVDGGTLTLGASHLHGAGQEHAINFGYCINTLGVEIDCDGARHDDEIVQSSNTRDFSSLYAQRDWSIGPLDVLAGLRVDHTIERAAGRAIDNTGAEPVIAFNGRDRGDHTRLSGSLGGSWHLWRAGVDETTLYADARTSFKPLATDFGPEAEVSVLKPETGRSFEIGFKSKTHGGRLSVDVSVFRLDLSNGLTFATTATGYGPTNGGENRYQGAEVETRWIVGDGLTVNAHYAYHDARVRVRADGSGIDLAGKAVELSPRHLGGVGLIWTNRHGWSASLEEQMVGARWLDPLNTLKAGAYQTLDASVSMSLSRGRLRLSGSNLTDRRDPVAASELQHSVTVTGTSGWYRMPSRQVLLSLEWPW